MFFWACAAAARTGGTGSPWFILICGLLLDSFGRPRPRGTFAGPNWPGGIRQRDWVRCSGRWAPSEDVEAASSGCPMAMAATPAVIWLESRSTLTATSGLMSANPSLSSTNLTLSASLSRTLALMTLSGTRVGQGSSRRREEGLSSRRRSPDGRPACLD